MSHLIRNVWIVVSPIMRDNISHDKNIGSVTDLSRNQLQKGLLLVGNQLLEVPIHVGRGIDREVYSCITPHTVICLTFSFYRNR